MEHSFSPQESVDQDEASVWFLPHSAIQARY